MNHASATLELSPTTVLRGRLLKGAASMSRLSLNALSACADDARKTREGEAAFAGWGAPRPRACDKGVTRV